MSTTTAKPFDFDLEDFGAALERSPDFFSDPTEEELEVLFAAAGTDGPFTVLTEVVSGTTWTGMDFDLEYCCFYDGEHKEIGRLQEPSDERVAELLAFINI